MLFPLFENVTRRRSESKSFNGWQSHAFCLDADSPVELVTGLFLLYKWKGTCCLDCSEVFDVTAFCQSLSSVLFSYSHLSIPISVYDYFGRTNTIPYVPIPCHSKPCSGSSRSPWAVMTLQSLERPSTHMPATLSPLHSWCWALPCSVLRTCRLLLASCIVLWYNR